MQVMNVYSLYVAFLFLICISYFLSILLRFEAHYKCKFNSFQRTYFSQRIADLKMKILSFTFLFFLRLHVCFFNMAHSIS